MAIDPGLLIITKNCDRRVLRVGDQTEVELVVTNLGATAFDVVLSDAANGMANIPGTVTLNGVERADLDLFNGAQFTVPAHESVIVRHRVRACCPGACNGVALAHYALPNTGCPCGAARMDTAVSNNCCWNAS